MRAQAGLAAVVSWLLTAIIAVLVVTLLSIGGWR